MKLVSYFLVVIILVLSPLIYVVGTNPIWYFVSNRSYGMVKLALKIGANPNSCDNRAQECPLFIAAVLENMKMIKILGNFGANFHILNKNGANVINVQCNNIEILGYFLSKGVNINNQSKIQGKLGMTSLHCAVAANNLEAVKLLISKGADKTKTLSVWAGRKNVTPLQLAEFNNRSDIVNLLN